MSLGGDVARFALVAGALVTTLASACSTSRPRPASTPAPSAANTNPGTNDDAPGDGEADDTEATATDDAPAGEANAAAESGPCPAEMVLVETATPTPRRFCVDTYEASLVEVLPDGTEKAFPHYLPVDGHDVRAVSKPGTFPQGYISEVQAQDACSASGKRLCTMDEWKTACMGPSRTTFPYGDARRPGACHDTGKSAVIAVFGAKAVAASTPLIVSPSAHSTSSAHAKRAHATKGRAAQTSRPRATAAKGAAKPTRPASPSSGGAGGASAATSKKGTRRTTGKKSARPASVDPGVWARLNDPGLGQVEGALSKTGEHAECVNGFGVFDMVGNLHEWVATDPAAVHGTFAGGYYLDTSLNGDGCNYRTVAHAHDYHDYSTGFRCCSGAAPPRP
jgi:hypothetical protein